jgi:iron complex transport system ATP-binding protein
MTLQARQVSFSAGNKTLLEDVSTLVRPGEVLALIGPNGAGKTTLLRLLSGEIKPESGQVLLEEKQISSWPEKRLARKRAIMPQQSALDFPFTALDVVMLGRVPHDTAEMENLRVAKAAMQAMDVGHLSQRRYTTLSGGERQRVQLARVFAQVWQSVDENDPAWLLLDEPVAALDLAHQHQVMRWLRERARNNAGVLVILHDLSLAARYADKLLLLQNGKVVLQGEVAQVLQEEILSDVYGLPLMVSFNETVGHHFVVSR